MQNMADNFEKIINDFFYIVGKCPDCGSELYKWKHKRDGQDRCTPICMICGYVQVKKQEELYAINSVEKTRQSNIKQYFKNKSIVPNDSVFDLEFSKFKTIDQETSNALAMAKKAVGDLVNEKSVNIIFTGKSGTGKTHLAMAICNEYLKRTQFTKKVLFVNYPKLLEEFKFAIADKELQRQLYRHVTSESEKADLMVIDDLGAELGGTDGKESSQFNNQKIYDLLEARVNKATIFTSNLSSSEISKYYGDRIMSRMLNNSKGNVFVFRHTKDKRINL